LQPITGADDAEAGDWVGKEIAHRLQTRSTVNDSTGSTIMIIIVGPMIGPAARCCSCCC
jgi:hypothetical protein